MLFILYFFKKVLRILVIFMFNMCVYMFNMYEYVEYVVIIIYRELEF